MTVFENEEPGAGAYATGGDDDEVVSSLAGAGSQLSPAERIATLVPQLRVVAGDPDEEELVALVAGLLAARAAASAEAERRRAAADVPPRGCWSDKAARLGVVRPGPGSWRASNRGCR